MILSGRHSRSSLQPTLTAGLVHATEQARYWRFTKGGWEQMLAPLAREARVSIFVNRCELVRILCTPVRLNHLVLGFLFNEGYIETAADVAMLRVCDDETEVDVRLSRDLDVVAPRTLGSGCGGAFVGEQGDLMPVRTSRRVTADQLCALMRRLQDAGEVYRYAGGVHAAALSDGEQLVAVAEDIGRHNTVDKVAGHCLLEERPMNDLLLLATGRLSSEIVAKAARMGVPVVASRNSATSRAVALAGELGIALAGYVGGASLTLYSHPELVSGAGNRDD